jgi:hypothetical protein
MAIIEHEEHTTATREQIWAFWADLPGWPKWDENLEAVTIDGPFESGTFGRLKPVSAKEVAIEILDVDAPNSFVDVQLLPKAAMRTVHKISEADDGGLIVTQTVTFTGPLRRIFSFILGRSMKRDMPVAIRKLVALAEAS